MLDGSKLAHFNFVGDSLIGEAVNIEAGAIIANYRNELDGADIRIRHEDQVIDTGVSKFGALVGDGCKIGANAVIAPGALLRSHTRVPRLGLIDQFAYEMTPDIRIYFSARSCRWNVYLPEYVPRW